MHFTRFSHRRNATYKLNDYRGSWDTVKRYLLLFKVRVKGHGHTLDVAKPCKQDKDRIVWARTVKLRTHTSYDKRTTIDFQGHG